MCGGLLFEGCNAVRIKHPVRKPDKVRSGKSRHFDRAPLTSGLPRLADILRVIRHVSKVPKGDIAPHPISLRCDLISPLASPVNERPVRLYAARGASSPVTTVTEAASTMLSNASDPLPLPDKSSIADGPLRSLPSDR
jgi:hypothetical protein